MHSHKLWAIIYTQHYHTIVRIDFTTSSERTILFMCSRLAEREKFRLIDEA